jgi:ribulose-bisphosphate carboxylase large chain
MAYQLALGGIQIIKDDHGLSNQSFSPFKERIDRVVEAVAKANQETGEKCTYWPNITSPADEIIENAKYAKQAGAGGMLLIASLIGWDTMRMLADDDNISLPIMSHPSFHSVYYQSKEMGFSAQTLYGFIPRLAGADATIFPNYIGRFPSTYDDCAGVIKSATKPMGKIKSSFPTPGGGLTLEKLPEYRNLYQKDAIYLMGGGLHFGNSLIENCRKFRKLVKQ